MKKLLLAFCVLFSVLGEAQTWKYYNADITNISSIAFDKQGNKWIGTKSTGIFKFDGNAWTNYNVDNGLVSNYVYALCIDGQGNIWVGTNRGLSKYDGNRWVTYTYKDGLAGTYVYAIAIDEQGIKWFGTDYGVSKFDGTTWTNYARYNSGIIGNTILSIAIDKQGIKWFGTNNGLSRYDDYNWTSYNKYSTNNGLSNNYVESITIDQKGNIWMLASGAVTKFDGYYWKTYTESIDYNPTWGIMSIACDKVGNTWLGAQSGVAKFDGNKWTSYIYTTSTFPENNIYTSRVSAIGFDNDGDKWFGGSGLSKLHDSTWTNYQPGFGMVTAIEIDKKGNKWIGMDGKGITRMDDSTWRTYTTANGLASNNINSISIGKNENKWVATDKGISEFNDSVWLNHKVDFREAISTSIDFQGNVWLGTSNGLTKFDGKNWFNYNNINGWGGFSIKLITIDNDGNKLIGIENELYKFDNVNWVRVTNTGTSYNITSIAVDLEGNIWLGTDGAGVIKYDGKINLIYNDKNGLINNYVLSISIDAIGNKWFGTQGGLSKFDGVKWQKFIVPNPNGYLQPFLNYINSIAIDSRGNKWLATGEGVVKLIDGGVGPINVSKIQCGVVFNDLNANSKKDPNETNIAGQIVKVDNNYTTTQNNGLFYTSLNNGTHTFTYRPQTNWQLTTDSSMTVTVTDAPIKDTLYFGVQPIANKHEIETKLTGTATRAGFQSKSWINYSNLGTLAEDGTVSYTLADEASLVQSFPVADSIIGKHLVWKYSNLIPNEQRQISITTQMPGVNYLGDTLVSISRIKSTFSEYSDTLKQVLTGSYDPNDKLVAQGIGSKGFVLFGKELEYTVRFQNTGTDTAFNVNIRDTLDMDLDVASLQIVASSHPVKLDLRGQNEATFRFEKIKLPYKAKNDLGSNGFVKYTIRPKKNLAENTPVKNKAYIYFDFNPAILTNETENTYVSKLPSVVAGILGFQSNKSACVFPNPAKDEFTIVFPQSGTYEVSLANTQGKSIKTWNAIVGQETTLSVEDVEPGMYLYTAQGRNGQKYMGKLVVSR